MFRLWYNKWVQFRNHATKQRLMMPPPQRPDTNFWKQFDAQMRAWEQDEINHFGRKRSFFSRIFKTLRTSSVSQEVGQAMQRNMNRTPPQATVAFMITKKMEVELKELGYKKITIDKLTPTEANFIIENKIQFKPTRPAHVRHTVPTDQNPIILGGNPVDNQTPHKDPDVDIVFEASEDATKIVAEKTQPQQNETKKQRLVWKLRNDSFVS